MSLPSEVEAQMEVWFEEFILEGMTEEEATEAVYKRMEELEP